MLSGLFKSLAKGAVSNIAQGIKTTAKEEGINMLTRALSSQPNIPAQSMQPQYVPQEQYISQPHTSYQSEYRQQQSPVQANIELETHAGCTCTCPKSQIGGSDIDQLTVKELKILARRYKIVGSSKMNRRELIDALRHKHQLR